VWYCRAQRRRQGSEDSHHLWREGKLEMIPELEIMMGLTEPYLPMPRGRNHGIVDGGKGGNAETQRQRRIGALSLSSVCSRQRASVCVCRYRWGIVVIVIISCHSADRGRCFSTTYITITSAAGSESGSACILHICYSNQGPLRVHVWHGVREASSGCSNSKTKGKAT
jgi:hypothetical protein